VFPLVRSRPSSHPKEKEKKMSHPPPSFFSLLISLHSFLPPHKRKIGKPPPSRQSWSPSFSLFSRKSGWSRPLFFPILTAPGLSPFRQRFSDKMFFFSEPACWVVFLFFWVRDDLLFFLRDYTERRSRRLRRFLFLPPPIKEFFLLLPFSRLTLFLLMVLPADQRFFPPVRRAARSSSFFLRSSALPFLPFRQKPRQSSFPSFCGTVFSRPPAKEGDLFFPGEDGDTRLLPPPKC